jgi:cytochrome c peroxidase|tara:strand:+ start:7653 stop:8753 length:1101 start_codon:yes stop_codon:yes gene_type:complete
MLKGVNIIFLTILLFSCKKDPKIIIGCTDLNANNWNYEANFDDGSCIYDSINNFQTTAYVINTPFGFPDMQIPIDNPMTQEGVELGEKLFNDPILSKDNSLSCTGCHIQINSFANTNQYNFGIDNILGFRNASAIINVGWNSSFNWDGSVSTLEDQAFEPVTNEIEMHDTWENVESKLNSDANYYLLFKQAFNIDYIDSMHIVKAIAQYERSLISVDSKYDKWRNGNEQLTLSELNGYAIFNTEKGDCFHCHGTEMFMDNLFHNNGLDAGNFSDLGLGNITNNSNDNAKFKTPTLRNVEFTGPYMHDGRFSSLEEVVDHYNSGGNYSTTIDPLMKKVGIGLQLTNNEKQDLVNFLKTLSDYSFLNK